VCTFPLVNNKWTATVLRAGAIERVILTQGGKKETRNSTTQRRDKDNHPTAIVSWDDDTQVTQNEYAAGWSVAATGWLDHKLALTRRLGRRPPRCCQGPAAHFRQGLPESCHGAYLPMAPRSQLRHVREGGVSLFVLLLLLTVQPSLTILVCTPLPHTQPKVRQGTVRADNVAVAIGLLWDGGVHLYPGLVAKLPAERIRRPCGGRAVCVSLPAVPLPPVQKQPC